HAGAGPTSPGPGRGADDRACQWLAVRPRNRPARAEPVTHGALGSGTQLAGRLLRRVFTALAQEALEVTGDRLAGGQRAGVVRLVGDRRLLQALDERLHLRVALHRGVDL